MIYIVELYEVNDETKIVDMWAFSNDNERMSFIVTDLTHHINYMIYSFREREMELDKSWSINNRYAREYQNEVHNNS